MSADLDTFLDDVAQSAYGIPDSLRFTYDKTRELIENGVRGDLVECGVANGVHPAMMARACEDAGERRAIRLFDSFLGVPNGGSEDRDWNAHYGDGSGRLEPSGVAVASLEAVQQNLSRWGLNGDLFSFYIGWFERTLPPIAKAWQARYAAGEAEGIAFLRLDGDLHSSTKVCLEHLYPLVVSGGVVVIDDMNLDGCARAFREYAESGGMQPVCEPEAITASGDVWWCKP